MEGASAPEGQQRPSAVTLQENAPHRFSCHSEGWDPRNPPLIAWRLNGKWWKQVPSTRVGHDHNGTLSLRPGKWNSELVCVASKPRTGERYNATITLSLQRESPRPPATPDAADHPVSCPCSHARDSRGARQPQRDLRPRTRPGPVRLGEVQPARDRLLGRPVRTLGGQHHGLPAPGLTNLPPAGRSHPEDHAQQPVGEPVPQCQQRSGGGAEQPHPGRSARRNDLAAVYIHTSLTPEFCLRFCSQNSCSLAWRCPCWES